MSNIRINPDLPNFDDDFAQETGELTRVSPNFDGDFVLEAGLTGLSGPLHLIYNYCINHLLKSQA